MEDVSLVEGNGYTVKELITNFVLPELREIKAEVKGKVDRAEFEKLELRMQAAEKAQIKEDDVVRILGERTDKSAADGLSRTQGRYAAIMALGTIMMVLLTAHAAGVL